MQRRPHRRVPVEFVSHDPRMPAGIGDRELVQLTTGCRWTEGPVYFPAGRYLLFSDIPNDRVLRYDELTGRTTVWAEPAGHHNGHFADRQGRLLSCEHGARRVTRTEADGSLTVLADSYDGKRLNSPNDLVEHTDGAIWFTDPAYGIDSDYEGHAAPSEIGCHVYRVVPGEQPVVVADDFARPNGIAFSPDETKLYVSDSERGHLRVFDVADGTTLSGGAVVAECSAGCYDGFRVDRDGRIWASTGEGIHVLDPDGTLLGRLLLPETVSNLTFGGPRRNDLYITATTSLYTLRTRITGQPFPC